MQDQRLLEKINLERLNLLYGSLIYTQIGMLLVGIILLALLKDLIPIVILSSWFVFLLLTITYRLTIYLLYNKISHDKHLNTVKWENIFIFGVFISALAWGSAGVLLYPTGHAIQERFIALIIVGIAAVSIGIHSSSLKSIFIFIPIILLPIVINSFINVNINAIYLTGMISIFIVISLISAKKLNRNFIDNISLQYYSNLKELRLQESEEKYRLLYEKSEDAMLLIHGNKISMANQAAVRLFGYKSIQHILSTNPLRFSPDMQPNGISSRKQTNKILKIVAQTGYYRVQWTYKRLNGRNHPADVALTSIPYEGDRAILCVLRDISDNKNIEKQLIKAQHKSDLANQAKSSFLAVMSHEIRTPMNGIIGITNLLLKKPLKKDQYKLASIIQQNATSMLTILNDILDFSKIEAGKLNLEHRELNLTEIINLFSSSVSTRIKSKGLDFECIIHPHIHNYYIGDEGRIRQILNNLVDNAIRFTSKGKITIRCRELTDKNNVVTLKFNIIDTGIGIETDQQNLIFDRFTQADISTTRKFGGTGLGLTICKQLAQLMGGEIGFKNNTTKGVNFWFTINLKKSIANHNNKKISATNNAEISVINAKILIVDDNETNQFVAKGILDLLNIDSDIVENGKMAVDTLCKKTYDLVLMDCQMPVMDGYEATRMIRNKKTKVLNPDIPIIAVTASAMQGDREKCIKAGMDDYIAKPLDMVIIQNKIQYWLANAKNIPEKLNTRNNNLDNKDMIFDYSSLNERLGKNNELISHACKKFINSIGNHIQEIKSAVRNKDLPEIISMSHKLKGSAATISCMRLSNLAYDIELNGKNGDYNKILNTVSQLQPCYIITKKQVEQQLENIQFANSGK